MDIAIVTGAETPLGLRIVQSLVQQGYRVHGIGNNFSKVTYADAQFRAHAVDLTDLSGVSSVLGKILSEEGRLDLLVHGIDVTPGTPFEKLPLGNLEAILNIGLLGPVMMTRLALPNLMQVRGQLINVITANKNGSPPSAANSLIEGGLREMNCALFDTGRDRGLRITNCVLRQNTQLPGATVSDEVLEQAHIDLEDVARTIEFLIDPKSVNVPQEIVLHPRLSPEATQAAPEAPLPLDAYSAIVLPPKEYCPPKEPKIPTEERQQIERTIPYTDEEMEDKIAAAIEDFEAHPERYEQPDSSRQRPEQGGGASQQEPQGKSKRRRRRRGGRNRSKNRDGQGEPQEQQPEGESAPQSKDRGEPSQSNEPRPSPGTQAESQKDSGCEPSTDKPRRKRSSKPREDRSVRPDPAPTSDPVSEESPAKVATKKAAKKTPVKKAAKKVPTKKVAAKKAPAKKAATKKAAAKKAVKKAPAKKAAKKAAKKKTAAKKAAKSVE